MMALRATGRRGLILLGVLGVGLAVATPVRADDGGPREAGPAVELHCGPTASRASGKPDPQIFSPAASKGIRALWCERYDSFGRALRVGPYRELYPNGGVRTEASFREDQLNGPLVLYHENGRPWLRSVYRDGVEIGPLEIFHPSGAIWLEGELAGGLLEGVVRTYLPEGSLESEIRFGSTPVPGHEDVSRATAPRPSAAAGVSPEAYPAARRPPQIRHAQQSSPSD
jgi:hypothetical protein